MERGEWREESGERNSLAQSEKRRAKPKIIWTTWLQGENEAPKVMKACWRSWRRHLPDYELRIVTLDNHRQWADLPEELIEKYRRGIMPPALLSDVLRLDLLTRHGGTWIDGTVLCTGFAAERLQRQWAAVEASPLCLFRYFEQGRKEATGLSTWFISASPGHAVLTAARNMLVAYWRDYNCTLNYYLPHLFISAALDRHPHAVATMPRLNSRFSLLLGAALTSPFDAEAWRDLTDHVAFHKLNFRKVTAEAQAPGTYCSFLLEGEGE